MSAEEAGGGGGGYIDLIGTFFDFYLTDQHGRGLAIADVIKLTTPSSRTTN